MHQFMNAKIITLATFLIVLGLSGCSSNSSSKANKTQQEQGTETDTSTKEVVRPLEALGLVPGKAVPPKPPVLLSSPIFIY